MQFIRMEGDDLSGRWRENSDCIARMVRYARRERVAAYKGEEDAVKEQAWHFRHLRGTT